MEHQFRQIIMTPIIPTVIDGEVKAVVDPEGDEAVQYGCIACNMGMEEAMTLPCPGFDILDEVESIIGSER